MRLATGVLASMLPAFASAEGLPEAAERSVWHFRWGEGLVIPADLRDVMDDELFNSVRGYGYEPPLPTRSSASIETSRADPIGVLNRPGSLGGPFVFSVRVPEGDYHVRAVLGGWRGEQTTVIKAESRRIMAPPTRLGPKQTAVVEFAVNVRRPRIDEASAVRLSPREQAASVRQWDDKLTLEFAGPHPAVASLSIEKIDAVTTVFLAGDSTVCDQPEEPWAGWGQILPQFFTNKVAVANYAESGRTLKSFKAEKRLDKLLSVLRPADWVFIQFGHNDMKEKGNGVGAFTTFAASLKEYVAAVRARGGRPVLLTPMHRRKFDGTAIVPTFGDYPEAVRRVAAEAQVPLIDLQAMSRPLYEAFGPERSKQLFVHFPVGTFPGQTTALKDDTHFRAFGGDQIARCVVQGIRDLNLPLAADLREGVPPFDPAKPDDPAAYDLPASAAGRPNTPGGR